MKTQIRSIIAITLVLTAGAALAQARTEAGTAPMGTATTAADAMKMTGAMKETMPTGAMKDTMPAMQPQARPTTRNGVDDAVAGFRSMIRR